MTLGPVLTLNYLKNRGFQVLVIIILYESNVVVFEEPLVASETIVPFSVGQVLFFVIAVLTRLMSTKDDNGVHC